MKRGGQIHSHMFIYIFIALFAIFILVFGFMLIQKGKETTETAQLIQIATSLTNAVDEFSDVEKGNKILDFSLPKSVRKVCISSGDSPDRLYADVSESDVTKGKVDTTIIDSEFVYSGPGVYFIPGEYFRMTNFNLASNPICSDVYGEVQFEVIKDEKVSLSLAESREECNSVLYNKDHNIDIVFLNHNLEDEEFSSKTSEYVDVFLSKEPLESNEYYFNFYSTNEKVSCHTEEFILVCDDLGVKQVALKCPHDYIVVLSDPYLNVGVRSSAKGNIMVINIQDKKLVLLHEFGHIFGRLDDEYVILGMEADDLYGTNCKGVCPDEWQDCPTQPECCFSGCSLNGYVRSSDDSLMRSFRGITSIKEFNQVSNNILLDRIEVYK